MPRLVDLLTVFIFLAAVVSNCVNAGEVRLGPAATALEDSASDDGSEPVMAAELQLLVAHHKRGDTTQPILIVQEILMPIEVSTIFLAFLAPAGAVVQLRQPTVLRL